MTRRLRRLSQELDVILKTRRRPGERYRRADGSCWEKPADGGKVVRITEPKRFPADMKTSKARELKASDWGPPEEVAEMAKTPRKARSRYEARQALEDIISDGGESRHVVALKSKSGLTAYLRRSSTGKLLSDVQKKEMPAEALWTAAANIDRLYANAIEPWRFEFDEEKNNDELKARRILYAPMEFQERVIPVMFTVKEYLDTKINTKLYAIEAIDFDIANYTTNEIKKQKTSGTTKSRIDTKRISPALPHERSHGVLNLDTCVSPPTMSYSRSIAHIFDSVNSHLIRKRRLETLRTLLCALEQFKKVRGNYGTAY
jgi:hypothetical protein